jgi:GTP-binding protein
MSIVPKVVIVGRPNVGKSSLLNWMAGKRISVVEPTAGVTRDRVTYLMHVGERYFELVDTGGIGIVDSDDLSADIEKQINIGINEADLILFVVDANDGTVPLDEQVARRLRISGKKVLVIANKCDSPKRDFETPQFLRLMRVPIVITSVHANRNRDELLTAIVKHLPAAYDEESADGERLSADPELKLAVVGRRNAGKSTFINSLAETDRMIVSEIPGTTRDSVDVRFELDGKAFIAIDTPGVRKRKSLANDIEYYGLTRAKRSIRRADVVLMFFDCEKEVSQVDKQLVGEITENFKPCIFVVNKWDLARGTMNMADWTDYLFENFPYARHIPVCFVTGRDGRNIKRLVNLAQSIAKQARLRVSTSALNQAVRAAVLGNRPPMRATKQPKIYFAAQVAVEPPTIVLKCNHPQLFDRSWQRYLLGVLREALPFKEVPIKVYYRARTNAAAGAAVDEAAADDPLFLDDTVGERLAAEEPIAEGDEFELEEQFPSRDGE